MSKKDFAKFLKSLDSVYEGFQCPECFQFCKNPVTLSKCFHIICSEHFYSLTECPKCGESLEGCTTWHDDKLCDAVEAARDLSVMLAPYKSVKDTERSRSSSSSSMSFLMPHNVHKLKASGFDKDANDAARTDKADTSDRHGTRLRPESTTNDNDAGKENPCPIDISLGTYKTKATNLKSTAKIHDASFASEASSSSKNYKGLEKKNKKGETALHIACRLGNIDKVEELLNQGANVNTKDHAGWTPLHEAVQIGRLDLVELLVRYNILINVPGQSNETPLHEAIRYGHTDIARVLVQNGADVNARNCKGETPLQLATGVIKDVLEQVKIVETCDLSTLENDMELEMDNIRLYCVSNYRTVHNKIKALVKNHSNLHLETKLTSKVTHLIVDAEDGICNSSLDVLQGIVNSLWIVTSQWVTQSSEVKLASFKDHEVVGVGARTYNGPRNSRLNKYKQLPGVFNGCHFYLHNFTMKYKISDTIELTKASLTKLITDAGGVVLRRVPNPESIPDSEKVVPYHAKPGGKLVNCSHYIIFKDMYEPMYNMAHLKALPIGWLIECLEKYELCEPW